MLKHLKNQGIQAVFHYLSLHESLYYSEKHDGRSLENSNKFSNTLIRMPFYHELSEEQVVFICNSINDYYVKQ